MITFGSKWKKETGFSFCSKYLCLNVFSQQMDQGKEELHLYLRWIWSRKKGAVPGGTSAYWTRRACLPNSGVDWQRSLVPTWLIFTLKNAQGQSFRLLRWYSLLNKELRGWIDDKTVCVGNHHVNTLGIRRHSRPKDTCTLASQFPLLKNGKNNYTCLLSSLWDNGIRGFCSQPLAHIT